MDLLFNKDGNGGTELKDILGFLDASISYKNLKTFLESSTREVINLIGRPTYAAIHVLYNPGPATGTDAEIIKAAQTAIAINAYRKYAPSNDVSHSNNGRRMRMDDHNKQAFEWMIDRDNEAMERMYYEWLDQLIKLMDDEMPSWKTSQAYKDTHRYFIRTTSDFEEFFNIGSSRLLLMKLSPGFRHCEMNEIIPRINQSVFDALKTKLKDNTALDATETALVYQIKEACVYWSLYWAMNARLTLTLFPEGILQRSVSDRTTTQGKKPAMMNEYAWAAQNFKADAEKVLRRIEDSVTVPEATEEEDTNVLPGFNFDEDDFYLST